MNGQEGAVEQGAGARVVVEATVQDTVQDTNQGTGGTVMDTMATIQDTDITCTKDNFTLEILMVEEISTEMVDTQEDNQRAQDPDLQKVEIKGIDKKNLRLKHLTRTLRIL